MNQLKRVIKMAPSRVLKKLCCFEEIYTIAYRYREGASLIKQDDLSFTPIPYHKDFWYADPILITHQGKDYLFAECFDMRMQKGVLGCAKFDENGTLSAFQTIIEEPYHLSFPMVFNWNEKLYMIPESSDNKSLNLYGCNGDLLHWEKIKEFSTERPLVDTVVLTCEGESVSLLSSAIHPEDPLLYQWQSLTLRKVDEDFVLEENGPPDENEVYTRGSRMAGKLVKLDGTTILPTQESTETDYGINLYLNEYQVNNHKDLSGRKCTVNSLRVQGIAGKEMIGVHTYAASEQFEMVDIRYYRFSPRNRWRKIVNKLRKLMYNRRMFRKEIRKDDE